MAFSLLLYCSDQHPPHHHSYHRHHCLGMFFVFVCWHRYQKYKTEARSIFMPTPHPALPLQFLPSPNLNSIGQLLYLAAPCFYFVSCPNLILAAKCSEHYVHRCQSSPFLDIFICFDPPCLNSNFKPFNWCTSFYTHTQCSKMWRKKLFVSQSATFTQSQVVIVKLLNPDFQNKFITLTLMNIAHSLFIRFSQKFFNQNCILGKPPLWINWQSL